MTDWKIVHYQERPSELDTESSPTTVYERRNIVQVTETYMDSVVEQWECEEREYSADEYAAMTSPATKLIMQTLSALELSIAEIGG